MSKKFNKKDLALSILTIIFLFLILLVSGSSIHDTTTTIILIGLVCAAGICQFLLILRILDAKTEPLIRCPQCQKKHSANDTYCPLCGFKRMNFYEDNVKKSPEGDMSDEELFDLHAVVQQKDQDVDVKITAESFLGKDQIAKINRQAEERALNLAKEEGMPVNEGSDMWDIYED